jgi:hypothetical protein
VARRHTPRGYTSGAQLASAQLEREAKVSDLQCVVGVCEQDVLELEIAVSDTLGVDEAHGLAQLRHPGDEPLFHVRLIVGRRTKLMKALVQVPPAAELHEKAHLCCGRRGNVRGVVPMEPDILYIYTYIYVYIYMSYAPVYIYIYICIYICRTHHVIYNVRVRGELEQRFRLLQRL